ncbi:hypothetical protein PMIN04_013122 [Paraphaeosphaeria minitans]
MAQRNDLGKRKADTNIANLYTEGDSTITSGPAEKRPCLNATMSAQAFSQEPLPPSRHGSENVAHAPTPNGTHLSSRLTRTLSASPSGTATTLTNPPFRSRLNGAPSPANHRASTFTAVNQLPRSDSFASDSCSDSSSIRSVQAASSTTGSDGPLPEVSLSPVTPNEASSHERLRPFSSSTQHQSGLGRKAGTDTSYIQTRLAPQATTTYPTEVLTTSAVPIATASLQNHAPQSATAVRTNNATQVLPLSAGGVPSLHHTIGRTIDHHSSSERDALPAPREVAILQCELLQLLLGYLFPRDGYEVEEADLLCSLEEIWAEHEQQFKLAFHRLFASYREALFAWISERRITTQLQSMIESEPSAETLETVDQVLAVNDLRILRLKWRTINALDGDQAISPEDLLCKAFAAMTRTDGTEPLFKRGLEKLEETAISAVRYEDLTISIHA